MKKAMKTLLAVIMAVCLSGCMKVRMYIDVGKKGNLTQSMAMMVSQALAGEDGAEGPVLSSMKESLQEQYPDAEITPVSEGEGDDAYTGFRVSGIKNDNVSVRKENNKYILDIKMDEVESDVNDMSNQQVPASAEEAEKMGFEFKMFVNMPAKAEATYGTVNENTVEINLLEVPDDVKTITVTCSAGIPAWAYLVGGIIVAGIIIYVVMSRKKGNA
jgi:hypothetical protein